MLEIQRIDEAKAGPPELPEPEPRPETIVNLADVEPGTIERSRVVRTRRDLGRAAGSVRTGLQHVEVGFDGVAVFQPQTPAPKAPRVLVTSDGGRTWKIVYTTT